MPWLQIGYMLDNGLDRKMPRVKNALHMLVAKSQDGSVVPTIEYLIARKFDVNYQVRCRASWGCGLF